MIKTKPTKIIILPGVVKYWIYINFVSRPKYRMERASNIIVMYFLVYISLLLCRMYKYVFQ